MKEKMTIRKINWISDLDIENLLAWFTDMSSQGYHFKETKGMYAVFEKSEAKDVNYICAYINRHNEDAIKNHKKNLGFEYLSSKGEFHYYRREVNSELQSIKDRSMYICDMKKLEKDPRGYFFPSLILCLVGMVYMKTILTSSKLLKTLLLENHLLAVLSICIFGISTAFYNMISSFRFRQVLKNMKKNIPINNCAWYKEKVKFSRIIRCISIVFAICPLILLQITLISNLTFDRNTNIADGDIGIVRIEDIIEGEYSSDRHIATYSENDLINYLEKKWSILVPIQYELEQNIIYKDRINENGANERAEIKVNKYIAINESIAKKLSISLLNYWDHYDYEKSEYSGIDELWIGKRSRKNRVDFIVRVNRTVYRIKYYDEYPIDENFNKILKIISTN